MGPAAGAYSLRTAAAGLLAAFSCALGRSADCVASSIGVVW